MFSSSSFVEKEKGNLVGKRPTITTTKKKIKNIEILKVGLGLGDFLD
jgi:hypothetical protein